MELASRIILLIQTLINFNYMEVTLKILKKSIFSLSLMGLMTINAWAYKTDFEFTTTQVAENVYSIVAPSIGLPTPENKGWNSNSHFVVTERGVLIFDTGSSESIGKAIREAIESVTNKPVRWVVNSHSHADHWLGNAGVIDTDTEIIASDQIVTTMKKYGKDDVAFFSRATQGATGDSHIMYPTTLLTKGDKRNLGGINVEFIFSNGGHSPGDVLMWLPKQKIIFGGDVLSSDWMPIITPDANVPNLIESLYFIVKLNPTVVLTGHGKATTVNSVQRDADLLSSVWKLVKEGHAEDKKVGEILSKVSNSLGPKYKPLYKNFDSAIKEQVMMVYNIQATR
jgi:glyoxylase-like metal-dependent hydrolase (beta-lactamase superfamily II)